MPKPHEARLAAARSIARYIEVYRGLSDYDKAVGRHMPVLEQIAYDLLKIQVLLDMVISFQDANATEQKR